MKKFIAYILIRFFLTAFIPSFLISGNAYAGNGTNCILEVTKVTSNNKEGWVKYEVTNPSYGYKARINGIKFFKSDGTLWDKFYMETSDDFLPSGGFRNKELIYYVKIPYENQISTLQCYNIKIRTQNKKQILNDPLKPPKKEKNKIQNVLDKIKGN